MPPLTRPRDSPASNELLAQAYYLSALESSEDGNYRRALELRSAYRKLEVSRSSNWVVPALLWAGEAEWSHGRVQHAVRYYMRAVDMDPFNVQGHMGLSMAYEAIGESARAGFHRQEARRLEGRPRQPYAISNLPPP